MTKQQLVEVKRLSVEGNGFITEEGAKLLEGMALPMKRSVKHSTSRVRKGKARTKGTVFVGLNKVEKW